MWYVDKDAPPGGDVLAHAVDNLLDREISHLHRTVGGAGVDREEPLTLQHQSPIAEVHRLHRGAHKLVVGIGPEPIDDLLDPRIYGAGSCQPLPERATRKQGLSLGDATIDHPELHTLPNDRLPSRGIQIVGRAKGLAEPLPLRLVLQLLLELTERRLRDPRQLQVALGPRTISSSPCFGPHTLGRGLRLLALHSSTPRQAHGSCHLAPL